MSNSKTFKHQMRFQGLSRALKMEKISRTFKEEWPLSKVLKDMHHATSTQLKVKTSLLVFQQSAIIPSKTHRKSYEMEGNSWHEERVVFKHSIRYSNSIHTKYTQWFHCQRINISQSMAQFFSYSTAIYHHYVQLYPWWVTAQRFMQKTTLNWWRK